MRKFLSSDWGINIVVALIFLLSGFAFTIKYYPKAYFAYVAVALLAGFYIVTQLLDQYSSKSELTSNILGPLLGDGFEIEHISRGQFNNDYWGLLGIYRGFPIRIYYGRGTGHKRTSQIFFTLYFSSERKDIERIRDKYVTKTQTGPRIYHYAISSTELERVDGYLYITSYTEAKKRIDDLVDIAIEGKFSPMKEENVPAGIKR